MLRVTNNNFHSALWAALVLSAFDSRIALAQSSSSLAISVPQTIPTNAVSVDSSVLSLSIEFFAFPGYTELKTTGNCLAELQSLRGTAPAVRIGGTTQDRATYDPSSPLAVNYTVPTPADAPNSLTYGPSFFDLANEHLKGDVTIGLNRQLNNITNSGLAAQTAKEKVKTLLAVEMGNEPDLFGTGSPIIPSGSGWNPTVDGASQKAWFTSLAPTIGNIFQAAVYISFPSWSTAGLIPLLGTDGLSAVHTFSGHAYPQSACGGASTNLPNLMSHSGIVKYAAQYKGEASAAHSAGKRYFLGETNSATCGGGGISPTFGAGLWIVDYVLQSALNGIERLYFHQGTIANCAYCFWGNGSVEAPFYGAAFVDEFLGNSGSESRLAMLDNGTGSVAVYALYSGPAATGPERLLVLNSAYFAGTGVRTNTSVSLTGIPTSTKAKAVKVTRLTAQSATSVSTGSAESNITIGGQWFDDSCLRRGVEGLESVNVSGGNATIVVRASEAIIVEL